MFDFNNKFFRCCCCCWFFIRGSLYFLSVYSNVWSSKVNRLSISINFNGKVDNWIIVCFFWWIIVLGNIGFLVLILVFYVCGGLKVDCVVVFWFGFLFNLFFLM